MQSHLLIDSLSCWAKCVILRKSLPIPIASSVFSTIMVLWSLCDFKFTHVCFMNMSTMIWAHASW
jgi:hypothetical protein